MNPNLNQQQFYHATDREIEGDHITPGYASHDRFRKSPSKHVFFTDSLQEASGWGQSVPKNHRVLRVEPTGPYEQRGSRPGDTFRNYMSEHPLRIVGEV